jgi:hypothetical protein
MLTDRAPATQALGMSFTGIEVTEQLTQDTEVSIGDLPVGSKVSVVVSARNATGESQPTDPISVVVP